MTIQFSAGRFTLTTANARIYLTQSELVTLLKFFGAIPQYDSIELLESEATIILYNNIGWFEQWDDLDSFALYTPEDWENLLDASGMPSTRLEVAIDLYQPIFSDN